MAVVMGTAGHIDHGKTTLVKTLTGIDCDRLGEEHKRGITIELGFAFMPLPNGDRLSIIDVPGHEKFVHTMMSGASGIDFVLLVIAADEGIMPQTREHLEICTLLGIKHGLVALTKVDAVDPELLALAQEEVESFLEGSFLEGAPIMPVSAQTGQGLDALRKTLADMAGGFAAKRRSDLFRLPVDRVFSMKGHGTVVTGTMISGQCSVGDEVVVYPSMEGSKVRSLQSHGQSAEVGLAGRRTAVNLQGLAVEEIERGDVIGHKGALFPSDRWIVELSCLPSSPRPLRHRKEIHFHHGARSAQARLYFLDREALAPGETALCEVRFTTPMVGVYGDRFVVRSFSPLRAVAGGSVVYPLTLELRRRSAHFPQQCAMLEQLARAADDDVPIAQGEAPTGGAKGGSKADDMYALRLLNTLGLALEKGVPFAALRVLTNLDSKVLEKLLQSLGGKQLVFCVDKEERRYYGAESIQQAEVACLAHFAAFHASNPMKTGMSRNEIQSGFGKQLSPKFVHFLLERLVKGGKVSQSQELYHLSGHAVSLASDQTKLREAILQAHQEAGMSPPNMKDVLEALKVSQKEAAPLIKVMQDAGEITKVTDGIWYASSVLEAIWGQVEEWFGSHDNLDVAGLKEITNLSRKYLIALLEFFDRERRTVRVGDKRMLRK